MLNGEPDPGSGLGLEGDWAQGVAIYRWQPWRISIGTLTCRVFVTLQPLLDRRDLPDRIRFQIAAYGTA